MHAGAATGRAVDLEPTVERREPVDEASESRSPSGVRAADAVVAHVYDRRGARPLDAHGRGIRARASSRSSPSPRSSCSRADASS